MNTPPANATSDPQPDNSADNKTGGLKRYQLWIDLLIYISPVVILIFLWNYHPVADLKEWFHWAFYDYNLLMAVIATMMPPVIALTYVRQMRHEKERRLERELALDWKQYGSYVQGKLGREFRFRNYIGSVTAAAVVIAMGASSILLLKPLPFEVLADGTTKLIDAYGVTQAGVDFRKGVNFLMLGPFLKDFGTKDV